MPLRPGALHLLNAVVIDPVDAPPVAGESRWASLAFRLPEALPE